MTSRILPSPNGTDIVIADEIIKHPMPPATKPEKRREAQLIRVRLAITPACYHLRCSTVRISQTLAAVSRPMIAAEASSVVVLSALLLLHLRIRVFGSIRFHFYCCWCWWLTGDASNFLITVSNETSAAQLVVQISGHNSETDGKYDKTWKGPFARW